VGSEPALDLGGQRNGIVCLDRDEVVVGPRDSPV